MARRRWEPTRRFIEYIADRSEEDASDADSLFQDDSWTWIDWSMADDDYQDWLKDHFVIPCDICKYYADQWKAKIKDPDGSKEYEEILRID